MEQEQLNRLLDVYGVAELTDEQRQQIQELEQSLGVLLIAYEQKEQGI